MRWIELLNYRQSIIQKYRDFIVLKTTGPIAVMNAEDTSDKLAPQNISWIDFWRAMTRQKNTMLFCGCCGKLIFVGGVPHMMEVMYKEVGEDADEHVAVGGHVRLNIPKYQNHLFIAPLCKSCNNRRGQVIILKSNTLICQEVCDE